MMMIKRPRTSQGWPTCKALQINSEIQEEREVENGSLDCGEENSTEGRWWNHHRVVFRKQLPLDRPTWKRAGCPSRQPGSAITLCSFRTRDISNQVSETQFQAWEHTRWRWKGKDYGTRLCRSFMLKCRHLEGKVEKKCHVEEPLETKNGWPIFLVNEIEWKRVWLMLKRDTEYNEKCLPLLILPWFLVIWTLLPFFHWRYVCVCVSFSLIRKHCNSLAFALLCMTDPIGICKCFLAKSVGCKNIQYRAYLFAAQASGCF